MSLRYTCLMGVRRKKLGKEKISVQIRQGPLKSYIIYAKARRTSQVFPGVIRTKMKEQIQMIRERKGRRSAQYKFQIKYNFFKALIYLKEYQWHKRMHFKGCIFSAKIGERFQRIQTEKISSQSFNL